MPNAFEGAMRADTPPVRASSTYTLLTVAVLAAVIIYMGWFFNYGLQSLGESHRRNSCMSNAWNLTLCALSFEVVNKRFPLASSQPFSGRPGRHQAPHPAGYSWLVKLLPQTEMGALYDEWETDSQAFQLGPFDPANNKALPQVRIPILYCPTKSLESADVSKSEYELADSPEGNKVAPARGDYLAFSSSHFVNGTGPGELYETDPQSPFDGNGVIPFPRTPGDGGHGIKLADIRDGTSKTLLLCESRETAYAAWCDGQAMWAVGAWPNSLYMPTVTGGPGELLGWPESDRYSLASIASGNDSDPALAYLPQSRYTAQHDRRWGPSSHHAGGVVIHAFADGHVAALSPDIDRNLYLRLISRDGGEAVLLP